MAQAVEHVTQREGEYYVTGTRVPAGVVIAAWRRGDSPQDILYGFPRLSETDLYGVISFYLDNRPEMDAHFAHIQEEFERAAAVQRSAHTELFARLDAHRTAHPLSKDVGTAR